MQRLLKYGMVFIIPALFILGVYMGGWYTYGPLLFAFGFIPLIELLFKPDPTNLDKLEKEVLKADRKYDLMLYLVVPAVYACIVFFLLNLSRIEFSSFETAGLVLSLGVVLGGLGINVAHELGHRQSKTEQLMAKALLLPSAYMHFFIEHNRGHHKNVSTEEDPASARLGESVYQFWIRSVLLSYISAWTLENKRLKRKNQNPISLKNEMIQYQIITIAYFSLILIVFGWQIFGFYLIASVFGFLLLETVNYIEHYGLTRSKVTEHRYEKVNPNHSWNSNHIVGRVMLFELSRHSDHHYQPTKKYQILDHHSESPQMPTGYPGMMLLSLIPFLWFRIMDKRIP